MNPVVLTPQDIDINQQPLIDERRNCCISTGHMYLFWCHA